MEKEIFLKWKCEINEIFSDYITFLYADVTSKKLSFFGMGVLDFIKIRYKDIKRLKKGNIFYIVIYKNIKDSKPHFLTLFQYGKICKFSK